MFPFRLFFIYTKESIKSNNSVTIKLGLTQFTTLSEQQVLVDRTQLERLLEPRTDTSGILQSTQWPNQGFGRQLGRDVDAGLSCLCALGQG